MYCQVVQWIPYIQSLPYKIKLLPKNVSWDQKITIRSYSLMMRLINKAKHKTKRVSWWFRYPQLQVILQQWLSIKTHGNDAAGYVNKSLFLDHLPLSTSESSLTRDLRVSLSSVRASLMCWISSVNFESIIFVSWTTVSILTNSAIVKRIAATDKMEDALWRVSFCFSLYIILPFSVQPSIALWRWILRVIRNNQIQMNAHKNCTWSLISAGPDWQINRKHLQYYITEKMSGSEVLCQK